MKIMSRIALAQFKLVNAINKHGNFDTILKNENEDTILQLMKRFPNAIKVKNSSNGEYLLHLACWKIKSEKVILHLLNNFPQASIKSCESCENFNDYPYYVREAFVMQRFFLADIKTNNHSYYPIHLAMENNQSEKVVLRLLNAFPQAASERHPTRGYLLHIACTGRSNQSEKVILALIDTNLLAIKAHNCFGETPLDYARYYQSELIINVLRTLMEMSDDDLKNRINIPMIVLIDGLDNRRRQEMYQWLLNIEPTKHIHDQERQPQPPKYKKYVHIHHPQHQTRQQNYRSVVPSRQRHHTWRVFQHRKR
jgi:hypothetical protein